VTEEPEAEPFYTPGWKPEPSAEVVVAPLAAPPAVAPSATKSDGTSGGKANNPCVDDKEAGSKDAAEDGRASSTPRKSTSDGKSNKGASSTSTSKGRSSAVVPGDKKSTSTGKAKPDTEKKEKRKERRGSQVETETHTSDGKKKPWSQRIREREEKMAKERDKYAQVVDDIMSGKFKTQGGGQSKNQGDMRIHMPSPFERKNTRIMILEGFRDKYRQTQRYKEGGFGYIQPASCPSAAPPSSFGAESVSSAATEQYSADQTQGLTIEGGHRPMARPDNVKLPKDFRKSVGMIDLQKLSQYNCHNNRKLVSVYGDIFDVSDRPDKYGEGAPYSWMSGADLTWGFVSGLDVPEEINKFYDLWKVAPVHYRDQKLRGILAWVAFYEYEYGVSVGQLEEYKLEQGLKGPPMEEANEDCSIM
jgi:predicted heme/steroid binding protein